MRLKKLTVKNFKSLRNCEVELDKFNVVIGPNASGKTNLVEVFKLLRKIYVEKDTNPFLEWWGYNNVVWAGKEELPITVGMLFDVDGYEVYFETTFTGTGGSFRILKEVLEVKGYFRIEKKGSQLKVSHDDRWLKKATKDVFFDAYENLGRPSIQELLSSEVTVSYRSILDIDLVWNSDFSKHANIGWFILDNDIEGWNAKIKILYPPDLRIWEVLPNFMNVLMLVHIPVKAIKTPQYPRKETTLNEDASNLIPLLYNIWLREGRLPEEIAEPLFIAFPNTRIFFQLTEDGRVMMKVFENDLELAPPGISDGFYKVLAILTAVYLKPPLLIIDEIENSLHPETLELIIDTLKESESQVIITTHSPVVVDIVEPSDLVLVDKENGETVFKRIKDPEKIKEFLNERGITLSEGWLYGSLFKNKEQ